MPGSGTALAGLLAQARRELERAAPRFPVDFAFSWNETEVRAAFAEPAFGRLTLHLSLRLGCLPFTIENAAGRREALRLLARFDRATGERWSLTRDGCIMLESGTLIDGPQTRDALVEPMALVLLALWPRLERMRAALR